MEILTAFFIKKQMAQVLTKLLSLYMDSFPKHILNYHYNDLNCK